MRRGPQLQRGADSARAGRAAAAACAFPLVHLILFLEIDDNVVSPSGSDSRRVLRRAGRASSNGLTEAARGAVAREASLPAGGGGRATPRALRVAPSARARARRSAAVDGGAGRWCAAEPGGGLRPAPVAPGDGPGGGCTVRAGSARRTS